MNKFKSLLQETYGQLTEQDAPPAPPAPPAPGGNTGDLGGGGLGSGLGDLGSGEMDMGGGGEDQTDDMDNDAKRSADPIAYTENVLQALVDPDEGITPEMFNDFIDTFGVGLAKIKDKEGFKRFYRDTYQQLVQVMRARDKLKGMFEQLHSTLQDVLHSQTRDPDNTNGGAGTGSAAGPGVK